MEKAFTYEGDELELFQHAKNWKSYFSKVTKPFIKGDVLEVGAGIGATTQLLNNGSVFISAHVSGANSYDFLYVYSLPNLGKKATVEDFRKIIETIGSELKLSKEKTKHSFSVLENYGNMSSPSVLFVLKEIFDKENLKEGELIFSAAFGPGLTMETAIFKTV